MAGNHTQGRQAIYYKNTVLRFTMQTISKLTLSDTMYFENTPALNYKIDYPQFTSTCSRRPRRLSTAFTGCGQNPWRHTAASPCIPRR